MSTLTLKTRLASGLPAFAVNVGGRNAETPKRRNAETLKALARHGAHAAFIDCERSGIALDAAAELLFAARAAGLPSLVPTHSAEQSELIRFLDCGADGLIVPHCVSAHDAAAAVEVMRYACGAAAADQTLIVQIETKNAVANLEAIAAVAGIDAFRIGPNDLAWEVCGERGAKNEQMTKIVVDICRRLAALGKRYGMPGPMSELSQFRRRGCTLVYYSMDWLVEAGMRELRGGRCHVKVGRVQDRQKRRRSECGGRTLGEACENAPRVEALGQLLAIERCAQQMAREREVLADGTEAREKRLRALRQAKASHAPLALTGGLMAVFGAIVHAGTGLHEHVPHVRKLQDLGFRGWTAAQLVGNDLAWCLRAGGEHALEEAFGCDLVAAFLQKNVEFSAMLIDGAPQQVGFSAQRHEHLVQMPGRSRLAACTLGAMRKARAELVAPAPDRLVADDHTALEQKFLDVAQAALKSKMPAHRLADHHRRESMT